MRRDAGCHTHGNAVCTVGKQVREVPRQNGGFALFAVISLPEIDRIFVDPIQQPLGDLCQARFRVAHGGGIIAINVPEIALPLSQRVALGEFLRESHKRIIDSLVPVGVEAPHYIANDTRRLLEPGIGVQPQLPHRIEEPPVHRFQTITYIRQSPVHDGRQRISEVTLFQRFAQIDFLIGEFGGRSGLCHNWFIARFGSRPMRNSPKSAKERLSRRVHAV